MDSRNANLNPQTAAETLECSGFLRSHASILANLDSSDPEVKVVDCLRLELACRNWWQRTHSARSTGNDERARIGTKCIDKLQLALSVLVAVKRNARVYRVRWAANIRINPAQPDSDLRQQGRSEADTEIVRGVGWVISIVVGKR